MTAGHIFKNQLIFEINIWKKEIEKIQQENAEMKEQLIYLIQQLQGRELLDSIEKYQTLFILQDRLIAILRNDVFRQFQLIREIKAYGSLKMTSKKLRLHKNIRKEIQVCDKEMRIIRDEFEIFVKHTDK